MRFRAPSGRPGCEPAAVMAAAPKVEPINPRRVIIACRLPKRLASSQWLAGSLCRMGRGAIGDGGSPRAPWGTPQNVPRTILGRALREPARKVIIHGAQFRLRAG